MLHLWATIANSGLCTALIFKKAWFGWKWVFWAQFVSIVLLVAHNYQFYSDRAGYDHWYYTFSAANLIVFIAYAIEFRCIKGVTFWFLMGTIALYILSTGLFEDGKSPLSNTITNLAQWLDCLSLFIMSADIFFLGGTHNARRIEGTGKEASTSTPAARS